MLASESTNLVCIDPVLTFTSFLTILPSLSHITQSSDYNDGNHRLAHLISISHSFIRLYKKKLMHDYCNNWIWHQKNFPWRKTLYRVFCMSLLKCSSLVSILWFLNENLNEFLMFAKLFWISAILSLFYQLQYFNSWSFKDIDGGIQKSLFLLMN